ISGVTDADVKSACIDLRGEVEGVRVVDKFRSHRLLVRQAGGGRCWLPSGIGCELRGQMERLTVRDDKFGWQLLECGKRVSWRVAPRSRQPCERIAGRGGDQFG